MSINNVAPAVPIRGGDVNEYAKRIAFDTAGRDCLSDYLLVGSIVTSLRALVRECADQAGGEAGQRILAHFGVEALPR